MDRKVADNCVSRQILLDKEWSSSLFMGTLFITEQRANHTNINFLY